MRYLSHLRVLALATTSWLATGCGHKEDAPQPSPPLAALNTHTVAVRYQARLLGGATTELPKNLNLLVAYERVEQAGRTGYQLSAPSVQFHDLAVSDTVRVVPLSLIATYAGSMPPKVTVSMWEDQEVPTAARTSYELTCELVLDGKVAGHTSYSVAAGQIPPLVASSQLEVGP
jgi:hypothetical protein